MLMTVLRGDLATKQSKALIRTFVHAVVREYSHDYGTTFGPK